MTSLILKILYKSTKWLEKASVSPQQTHPGINVDLSSQVDFERLRLKPDCQLTVGKDSQVDGSIIFEREGVSVSIGDRTFMNATLSVAESISIGDDVLMAWGVTVLDHNSHSTSFSKRAKSLSDLKLGKKDWSHVKTGSVKISNKAWIGFNSIILKGVTIGEGAVIGAGSIVAKDVPDWTIVAGNPARVIRVIPEDER